MADDKKGKKVKIGGMSIEAKGDLRRKKDADKAEKAPAQAKPKEVPDISSQDVAAREFTQRVKGYDPQEVKEFLDAVALKMAALEEKLKAGGGASDEAVAELQKKIEALEKENARLKAELESAAKGEVPPSEKAAKIIARAEELADAIKAEAEQEAKARLQEAELEISGRRKELERELEGLKNETERLSHLKEDFINRVEATLREFNDIIARAKKGS